MQKIFKFIHSFVIHTLLSGLCALTERTDIDKLHLKIVEFLVYGIILTWVSGICALK